VAPARADYEQAPEHFGASGESAQLYGSLAMAINDNGTGGVEAGSFYVVGENSRVLRFSAGVEGKEPEFREAWGWSVGNVAQEFQRCGPAYAAEPRPAHTFANCTPAHRGGGGEQGGHFNVPSGVAVNQATGDVYVLNPPALGVREHHSIEVFTATGTPIGEGFGDWGRKTPFPSESIAEGPEKLHEQSPTEEDGFAVNEAGTVFVTDRDFSNAPGSHAARAMSFEPEHAGNYEHYVYAGQGKDITTSFSTYFHRVAMVGSNRLVVASKQQIREYPTLGGSSAICSYEVPSGQVNGMTTNSVTGEVFYFREGVHSKIARLGPCNPATGRFEELQVPFSPKPEAEHMYALAVNPDLAWNAQRPQGVLYGADPQVGTSAEEKGLGYVFVPAVAEPPAVESESVANTTSTSSTLQARIDPRGVAVIFHFEYLSEAEYLGNGRSFGGPNTPRMVPVVPGELGSGGVGTVTAAIANLVPGSEYVFRVIAERRGCAGVSSCEAQGSVAAFATFSVAEPGLPDGRVYELVSPAQKQDGEVFPADDLISSCLGECKPPGGDIFTVFPMQSAPGGDAVSYMGYPFSANEGASVFNSYISQRTVTGWQTTVMSPRLLANNAQVGYAESLDQGVIATEGGAPLAEDAPAGYEDLYLQNAHNPADLRPLLTEALFEALSASGRPYRKAVLPNLKYAGHSPDFSAQYFEANDSLTFAGAYAPEPPDPGSAGRDLYEWREGNLNLVNVLPGNTGVATGAAFASASPDTNAIADDGHRVFWTAGSHLYVREDNRTTREVHDPGAFLTASPDGLQVLLSDGCLYSLTSASCSADLTQGHGGFKGIAGQSRDLSRIYFLDSAVLPGENERKETARSGEPDLYLYEAGTGTRFIAILSSSDAGSDAHLNNDWSAAPGNRTAEASPDGRYLAFGSIAQLTGYANVGPCEMGGTSESALDFHFIEAPCKEVFLYDSVTGRLTCPSCDPTGEAPLGNSTLRRIYDAPGWLPQPSYLSDQGRLFFDSTEHLSARDTNGRVEDVYEAEPAGVGSCTRPAGCISLISSGTGSVDSNFLAMDENGSNVFFTTRDRLVSADTDELLDVYDARIGGGFPEGEAAGMGCGGESCQSPPSPPQVSSSATSSYQGTGNLKPAATPMPCPQGQVEQNGQCVKVQKKKPKAPKKKAKARKKKRKARKTQVRSVSHRNGGSK
jgi:hypothetical protein